MSSKYLLLVISVILLKLAAGNDVLYLDEQQEFSTKNIWKRYVDIENDYDEAMRSNSQNDECSCSCRCNKPEFTSPQPQIIQFELPEWRLKPFVSQIQFGQPSSGQPQRGQFQGGISLGPEFTIPQIGASLGFGQPQEFQWGEQSPEGRIPHESKPPSDTGDQSPSNEIPESKNGKTPGTNSVTGQNQTHPSTNSQIQGGLPKTNTSSNAQGGLPQGGTSVDSQGNIPNGGFSFGGQLQDGYDTNRIPENGWFQTIPYQWGSNYRDGKPQGGISVSSDASLPQLDMSIGNTGGQNQGGASINGGGGKLHNGLSLGGMLNNLGGSLSFGGQPSRSQTGWSVNGQNGLQGGESQEDRLAFGEDGNDKKDCQDSKSNGLQDQDGQSSAGKSQGSSQSQKNSLGGNVDGGQLLDLSLLSPQVANNLNVG